MVFKGMMMERIINSRQIKLLETDNMIRENFLFPFRGRILTQEIETKDLGTLRIGDMCLLNLISDQSTMIFSYGPRSCPGQAMVRPLLNEYIKFINSLDFIPLKTEENEIEINNSSILKSSDTDTPFVTSRLNGFIRDRKIINKNEIVPVFISNESTPLRNIWSIYSNTHLMSDISNYFKTNIIPNYEFDIIVAPEARALPLAGMISSQAKPTYLPIIVMTKTDKFGPTINETYSRGYTDEKTTIHLYKSFIESVEGKRVLFVDDGLASGGTTLSCIDLINKCGGTVTCIFVIVKHNYCQLDKEYEQYYSNITHVCYDLDSPIKSL